MNKKIPAKDLKPGDMILYRLQWYEFRAYADNQIMFSSEDGEIISKMVFPNFLVTVKPGEIVRETHRLKSKGLAFYHYHEECWIKPHKQYAHTLSMCGSVEISRSIKAELMNESELCSDPGCVYCDLPLKKGA